MCLLPFTYFYSHTPILITFSHNSHQHDKIIKQKQITQPSTLHTTLLNTILITVIHNISAHCYYPAVRGIITSSEVQLFKKSIVKSHADFPDFNGHVSKWNITKQNYKAVAANHGISRILDDSPVPPLGLIYRIVTSIIF